LTAASGVFLPIGVGVGDDEIEAVTVTSVGGHCWMLAMDCFISVLAPFTNELQVLQFWGAYEEPIGVDELCGFDFADSNAPL